MTKAMKCYLLLKEGHQIVTEGIFAGGKGRADIIDLTEGIVFEVLCSEQEENILKKMNKYPLPIETIKARDFSNIKL